MSSRFVRPSKYRHVFPAAAKRELCYNDIRISSSADSSLVKVNPTFLSVILAAQGGGSFLVVPLERTGKFAPNFPSFNGHKLQVLDIDFNPFNDHVIASASEDATIMVWNIPAGGVTENVSRPAVTLKGHQKKVPQILFHPTAANLLASSSADLTLGLWDIEAGKQRERLTGHTDPPLDMAWNYNGTLLAITSKVTGEGGGPGGESSSSGKKSITQWARIFDVRKAVRAETDAVMSFEVHQGVKGGRVTFAGDKRLFTTGFDNSGNRQIAAWDLGKPGTSVVSKTLDSASGVLIPYYDPDTSLLFIAGKGDTQISYFEWEEDVLHDVSVYKSTESQKGVAFMPKRGCNISEVETARAYRALRDRIEPVSFQVPRKKSDQFQSDLYPDTAGDEPALSLEDYFAGKSSEPKKIKLEGGFKPSAKKEFVASSSASQQDEDAAAPKTEKEYQDAYHALRKEVEQLKQQLAQKDVQIRQLEAHGK